MCASDTSPCTYHKTTIFCTVIVIVSNSISRKMSVSHDIIIIEHNPKLPIRVLFCCFLCTVCSIVSAYLMLAIHVVLCSFRRTVFSIVSDSLIRFHTNLYTPLFAWIGRRVNSIHTSSVLKVQQLHTADILSEAYLLPIPKEHKLCSLPK